MHRRPLLLAAALATLAPPLQAGATVEILSQVPATIYVDGEYLGPAPMTLTNLAPGTHMVEASVAGERRTFQVVSPSMADVHRVLHVGGGAPAQPVEYAPPPVVYQPAPAPAPVQQVVYAPAPAPVVYAPPAPVCTTPTVLPPIARVRRSNRHVRVRNTLLGLGAAALLFKKVDRRSRRDRHRARFAGPRGAPPVVHAPPSRRRPGRQPRSPRGKRRGRRLL